MMDVDLVVMGFLQNLIYCEYLVEGRFKHSIRVIAINNSYSHSMLMRALHVIGSRFILLKLAHIMFLFKTKSIIIGHDFFSAIF